MRVKPGPKPSQKKKITVLWSQEDPADLLLDVLAGSGKNLYDIDLELTQTIIKALSLSWQKVDPAGLVPYTNHVLERARARQDLVCKLGELLPNVHVTLRKCPAALVLQQFFRAARIASEVKTTITLLVP